MHDSPNSASWNPLRGLSATVRGTVFGIISAISYTAANTALKSAARPHDFDWAIWVSCAKAVPAALIAWMIIAFRARRGLPALPPRKAVLPLLATGLLVQVGGNVMFQWSLGLGGLALTVPLSFSALICVGAGLGRIVLSEPITRRTAFAMALTIAAIGILSFGAQDSTRAIASNTSFAMVAAAVLAACCAGAAYGTNSVVIRSCLNQRMSVSATLVLLNTSGIVWLGTLSIWRLGLEGMASTTTEEAVAMIAAGGMNAAAFFSVAAALRYIPVLRVNLLNASQTAMAATVGVIVFGEQASSCLIAGTLLTIIGLSTLGIRKAPVISATESEGIASETGDYGQSRETEKSLRGMERDRQEFLQDRE